jgi:CBS domain containing-hemolysin-like protein
MLELLGALLCVISIGYLVLLLRSYQFLSVAELKRRARTGDPQSKAVYSIRGVFGSHVILLIWALIGLLTAITILLLGRHLWGGVVIIILAPLTMLIYAVLPQTLYPSPGLAFASFSVPVVRRILPATKPLFTLVDKLTRKWTDVGTITKVNSKEELLEILQHTQLDTDPFSKDELAIAVHALTFGDKKITEVMTPRLVVKYVRASDILSPVLLGELHESGFSRFPVIESEKGNFVGVLYSKDLSDLRAHRTVGEVMRPDLYYVNEFTSLDNVLNAFLRTQHHLFLVVNEFEEIVGLITIEDVLEQIIGRKIVDEFDQYADLRAVAKQLAQKEAAMRTGESL